MSETTIYDAFFPDSQEGPFTSLLEEREAFLRFLNMLCLMATDRNENLPEEAADRVGALLSDQELVMALEPHEQKEFQDKNSLRQILNRLLERGREAVAEGIDCPITRLFLSGYVDPLESLALLMAFSSTLNRGYERIYGILQEEKEAGVRPTVGLCLDLAALFLTKSERDPAVLLDPDSYLNRILMDNRPSFKDTSEMARSLKLREMTSLFLCGKEGLLGDLRYCAEEGRTLRENIFTCYPDLAEELSEVYGSMRASATAGVIELTGETGSGRRFLMRKLSASTHQPLVVLRVRTLLSFSPEQQTQLLSDLILKASLENSLVYLTALPPDREGTKESGRDLDRILGILSSYLTILFLGTEKPLSENVYGGISGTVYRMTLPEADVVMQQILWKEAAEGYGAVFDRDISLQEVVSKYNLNPGRIFQAMDNAVAVSELEKNAILIRKDTLEEQIRRICSVQFGEQAVRLQSPFTWEDLVVDENSRNLLKSACDRVRYRSVVNDSYGFGKKLPYGRGLAIVLYGPPGTGKTMAAQVIAKDLGLDIYRIDLSRISSKYIGETEKNLGAVFEAARNSNAILFFDEADSLFSKRTEVNSSNDKYANAETAYLLQKIEEYPGVSVLATNNMQNFDVAFKRRMTYLIPIGIPDEETRQRLWEKSFPEDAPLARDVDFKVLSKAVELSGAAIKNSAVAAAYMAAAENRQITMMDIAQAVDLECAKTGKLGAQNDILQLQFTVK